MFFRWLPGAGGGGALRFVFPFFLLYVLPVTLRYRCSSTQSWGSVLLSIVETRDKNLRGNPLFLSYKRLRRLHRESYLGPLTHDRQRQYSSLNTMTCKAMPFSIKFQ